MKKKKFKGVLGEPMKPRRMGLLTFMNAEAKKERMAEWENEDTKKIILLCDHYGITAPTPYEKLLQLSITLAKEVGIPAFCEKKRTGPKQKWTPWTKAVLVVELERLAYSKKLSFGEAAIILSKKEPWSFYINENNESWAEAGETLERYYFAAKESPASKMMREAFNWAHDCDKKRLKDWDNFVISLMDNQ